MLEGRREGGATPMNGIPIEIFDADGHDRPWPTTEAELDSIVASYSAEHPAGVNIDHAKGGAPLAVIDRVWRQGKKLVATLRDARDSFVEDVRAGRFVKRSVELAKDSAGSGHLTGLAFLYAKTPACKGLAPLPAFADGESLIEVFEFDMSISPLNGGNEEGSDMDAKEFAEQLGVKDGQIAEFAEQLKEKDARIAVLEGQVAEFAEARKREVLDGRIKSLTEAGKVTPATEPAARAYLGGGDDATNEAHFAEAQEKWPVVVEFGARKGDAPPADEKGNQESEEWAEARKHAGV